MFGLSIFLGDELTSQKKLYIHQMKEAGFTRVFTSLHIPEEDSEQYIQRLNTLGSLLKEWNMELIADVSKKALEKIGISSRSAQSLEQVKQTGVAGLRVDYGFSNEEIAFMSQHIKVVLNASTITENDVAELTHYKAQFPEMFAMHNYYPRPETGLDKKQFQQKNQWLKTMGFTVAAFVSGDKELRGPLYQHLPTLEDHRNIHPLAAAIDLLTDCQVDDVYIGDPEIDEITREQFNHYINESAIIFYADAVDQSPYFKNVLGLHQNRWDPAKDVLRSAEARFKKIEPIAPYATIKRRRGSITIDNEKYQRYMGEIQVVVHDLPADEKVNVAGQIRTYDQSLLDWCKAGTQFEIKNMAFIKEKE